MYAAFPVEEDVLMFKFGWFCVENSQHAGNGYVKVFMYSYIFVQSFY